MGGIEDARERHGSGTKLPTNLHKLREYEDLAASLESYPVQTARFRARLAEYRANIAHAVGPFASRGQLDDPLIPQITMHELQIFEAAAHDLPSLIFFSFTREDLREAAGAASLSLV